MGIRLYPNTTDVASLETLAGVPAGTAARLAAMEARHAAERADDLLPQEADLGYYQWKEIQADEDLGTYSHFLTFGWGKFDSFGLATGYGGELNDEGSIRALFRRNNINPALVPLCEGVHWC